MEAEAASNDEKPVTTRERQPARRWVAHVDMDAFFASVEQLDHPSLAGLPLVVANSTLPMHKLRQMAEEAAKLARPPELLKGVRGVVSSASYAARKFGVRSAMPLARALVLCPQAVIMPGRFRRYREVAEQLRAVWSEFSPLVEPLSLDEAYLDFTGSEWCDGPIRDTGVHLKQRIREETSLTASVGMASNKLVAKIASDLQKPDGLVVVEHGEEANLLATMPVRVLPGIGTRTAEVLARLGIVTLGQLAAHPEAVMARQFGVEQAASLRRRAMGIDNSPVELPGDPKSISKETTLSEDTRDLTYLETLLWNLSDEVAWQMRCDGFHARCVYIKLRLLPIKRQWSPGGNGFGRLTTRRITLDAATGSARGVGTAARGLLRRAYEETGLRTGTETVRLAGIGVTTLVPDDESGMTTFGLDNPTDGILHPSGDTFSHHERDGKLDASMDRIRARFGFDSIQFGSSTLAKGGDEVVVD